MAVLTNGAYGKIITDALHDGLEPEESIKVADILYALHARTHRCSSCSNEFCIGDNCKNHTLNDKNNGFYESNGFSKEVIGDGIVRYTKKNEIEDDEDNDEGGFYESNSSECTNEEDGSNKFLEIVKEFSKFTELIKQATDKMKADYKDMQAKVASFSPDNKIFEAEMAEVEQKFQRLQGKTEMAASLLSKKEKELEEKEYELGQLHVRIDEVEKMMRGGSTSIWQEPPFIPRPTKKCGIDPFHYDVLNFGMFPESVEYINISKINEKSNYDNGAHGFPSGSY